MSSALREESNLEQGSMLDFIKFMEERREFVTHTTKEIM